MPNVGVVSYAVGALAFVTLAAVLAISWRGRVQGLLLTLAAAMTAAWSGLAAWHAAIGVPSLSTLYAAEIARDIAWFAFLLNLLNCARQTRRRPSRLFYFAAAAIYGVCFLLFALHVAYPWLEGPLFVVLAGWDTLLGGQVLLAVTGLALVEQLFRNTRLDHRWAMKYLCLGLGGVFAYDFYLYSDALLLRQLDASLWSARGFVDAIVAPLIAVSAARNPEWSLDIFVSRRFVFHTTALLGTGSYLLLMAAGGYYVRSYGGNWGAVAQTVLSFAALVVLLLLLFSGQIRAHVKIFLSRHFFSYKYDYRDEWNRFTRTLSAGEHNRPLPERVIQVIAEMVESPGGALWTRGDVGGVFQPCAHWQVDELDGADEPAGSPLLRFLETRQTTINLDELRQYDETYDGLELPVWLGKLPRAWLIVPLMHQERLFGFVVLQRSRAPLVFNWEDRELLKTAGYQAASHLAQLKSSQALLEARQFEAFSRLSAFVVHDLKNVIAQLSLLVANAQHHKHNPEFVDDAIRTVDSTVGRMTRLMSQLRGGGDGSGVARVELSTVLFAVVAARSTQLPRPVLEHLDQDIWVNVDPERLATVVGHVVQNAQEATADDGHVWLALRRDRNRALLEIRDDGRGMDPTFVRDRLFRPFDTTKGRAGMGIGAYECREFIRSLGGEVSVASKRGAGTSFRILLPMAGLNARADERIKASMGRNG